MIVRLTEHYECETTINTDHIEAVVNQIKTNRHLVRMTSGRTYDASDREAERIAHHLRTDCERVIMFDEDTIEWLTRNFARN